MNTARRNLLKVLGLAPVAAPLAAKAAADAQIANLTGLASAGAPAAQYAAYPGAPVGGGDYLKAQIAAHDYSKLMGLPDFVKERCRRQAQYVDRLDVDIAAKRSWSMSVKIATQRERNYARQIEYLEHQAWSAQATSAFKAVTGWDWPW